MFKKLAEIAAHYLTKGTQAYFEGKLQTRKWQDQNGNDRYSTEIVAHEMQMLGGKPDNQGQQQASAPQAASGSNQEQQAADDNYDDIPF